MYSYYRAARDKSWKTLIDCKINVLPVDLRLIINHYNILAVPYSKEYQLIKNFSIDVENSDGFSVEIGNQKVIYFNDKKGTKYRRRFTMAHELGHCLLNHDLTKIKYRNSELDFDSNSIEEMQANVFARDILMPAVVLHFKKCLNCKDIMALCDVSETSAKIRAKRMKVLEKRNKFCTSKKEIEIYKNFFTSY